MPEFFKSTAKKPGATKVRKGYKSGGGDWIQGAIKRPGAFTKKAKAADMSVGAYANKVLKKGYPSGGVSVKSFRRGGATTKK